MVNLSSLVEIRKVKASQATGTTAVNSDAIDMANAKGVMIFTALGTANAANILKIQQSVDAAFTSPETLDVQVVSGANGEVAWIDLVEPEKRYVRAVIERGVTTTVGEIYAFKYGQRVLAPDNEVDDIITGVVTEAPDVES